MLLVASVFAFLQDNEWTERTFVLVLAKLWM